MSTPEEQLMPIKAAIPNGDKMILGLGDATVRLSENAAGKIISPARMATKVSSKVICTAAFTKFVLRLKYEA